MPYFGSMLDNCISHLTESKNDDLVFWILSSLHKCFLHDRDGFITKERFEKLLRPLVDQLDHLDNGKQEEIRVLPLISSLVQLAVCVNNDVNWKTFRSLVDTFF